MSCLALIAIHLKRPRGRGSLDDLAKRGKLERAESPLPKRQTVQGGVASEQYQRLHQFWTGIDRIEEETL